MQYGVGVYKLLKAMIHVKHVESKIILFTPLIGHP